MVSSHTVSAASHYFTNSDVGSTIVVLANTGGWAARWYHVRSVQNGQAPLDGNPGTVGPGRVRAAQLVNAVADAMAGLQCFLRFLAEQAGVSVPRDKIVLMGHSSGGHLVATTGFAGNNAFATNCENSSTNYTIKGIVSSSPPTDLLTA
jgi:hypothetical protein